MEFCVEGGCDKNTLAKWGQVKVCTYQPHNRRHYYFTVCWVRTAVVSPGWWGLTRGSLMSWEGRVGLWRRREGWGWWRTIVLLKTQLKEILPACSYPLPPQVRLSIAQPLSPNTLCTHQWLFYHTIMMSFNSTIPLGNGLFSFLPSYLLSSYHGIWCIINTWESKFYMSTWLRHSICMYRQTPVWMLLSGIFSIRLTFKAVDFPCFVELFYCFLFFYFYITYICSILYYFPYSACFRLYLFFRFQLR